MTWLDLLTAAAAIRAAAAATADDTALGDAPVVGVGWATVEADRAFEELAAVLPGVEGGAGWLSRERDGLLGASVWQRDPSPAEGVSAFVLEPDTEGRLAAFLARFGEGVGAIYLSGGSASVGSDGPRIIAVNPRWGPYAIVRDGS